MRYMRYPLSPIAGRTAQDIIPPELFTRAQLDRPFMLINELFLDTLGLEKTPLQASVDSIGQTGSVSLFDVGCGTGHTLKTWADTLRSLTRVSEENIALTGLSKHNYSQESIDAATVEALAAGEVKYITGDATAMREVPDNLSDITLCHKALIYSSGRKAVAWLNEMRRATRPGGSLFFNISGEQNLSDSTINEVLYGWKDEGCMVDVERAIPRSVRTNQATEEAFCRVELPSAQ